MKIARIEMIVCVRSEESDAKIVDWVEYLLDVDDKIRNWVIMNSEEKRGDWEDNVMTNINVTGLEAFKYFEGLSERKTQLEKEIAIAKKLVIDLESELEKV